MTFVALSILLVVITSSALHINKAYETRSFILTQYDYGLSSKLLHRYIYEISTAHSDIYVATDDQHFTELYASLQTRIGFIVLSYDKTHLIDKFLQPSIINSISINAKRSPESHSIHFVMKNKTNIHTLCLGSTYSILSLLELIGVRFRIHADTIPRKINVLWNDILYETITSHKNNYHWFFSPSFSPRGIQPFHAYSEGPDWWNHNEYKMISEQMYKMKMNAFGYHTYPVREALVWYGTKSQFNSDTGDVLQSYPASWITTLGWVGGGKNQGGDWGATAMNTSAYVLGSSQLYPYDCYSSEIQQPISDHLCPYPSNGNMSEQNEVFNNAGHLLHDVFGYAKQLGISAIVGTEIPLTIPPMETCQGPICALQDFYSISRNDHFVTATNCAECEGLYKFVRTEGWIHKSYDAKIFNITLLTCWNSVGLDSLIAVGNCPKNYDFVRITGYASAINQTYNNVPMIPLYMYTLSENNVIVDHWTIANSTSAKEAVSKGYATNSKIIAWVLSDGPSSPYTNNSVLDYYEGMFARINASYPIDYYWLWTPENWEWQQINQSNPIVTESINDILTAYQALNNVGKPFKLATAGWVLGPLGNRSMFDYYLPKDVIMTSIEMEVGWSEPDPAYGLIKDRETWSIPWMEDDPGLTALQLWVNRTMEHIYLSQQMNVNGLLGLNWRTQEVSPQFSVLASMGWNITNEYGERNIRLSPKTSLDFWLDFVSIEFGLDINENNTPGYKLATLLDSIDSFNLPRQSIPRGSNKGLPMFGCPGIIEANKIPWANISTYWTWVDQYISYYEYINGTENTERFNYWKYMFTYFKMMAKVGCDLGDIENIDKSVLINDTTEMMNNLMASLTTTGTMGTITDTQQKFFPYLSKVTNVNVTQLLPQTYSGITRVFVLSPRSIYLIDSNDANGYYNIKVIILSKTAPSVGDIKIYYRALTENTWNTMNVKQLGANGQVYSANIQITQRMVINNGFEYFVEVKVDNKTLKWPSVNLFVVTVA